MLILQGLALYFKSMDFCWAWIPEIRSPWLNLPGRQRGRDGTAGASQKCCRCRARGSLSWPILGTGFEILHIFDWVVVSKFEFSSLLGEMIQFDESIFRMGWNHQLVICSEIWADLVDNRYTAKKWVWTESSHFFAEQILHFTQVMFDWLPIIKTLPENWYAPVAGGRRPSPVKMCLHLILAQCLCC